MDNERVPHGRDELIAAANRMIERSVRQRHERIERAREEALQGGEHGVLVTHGTDGGEVIEVSEDVPYGWIYYRPAMLGPGSIQFPMGGGRGD